MVNPNLRANPKDPLHREFVLRFSRRLCAVCNQPVTPDDLDFDYIIPKQHGGPDVLWNVRAAHRDCRQRRASVAH